MATSDKAFQKRTEDFRCGYCGNEVQGDGYTNHCPRCLYSRHVDIHPGDRAAACGGLMEPIGLEKRNGEERLIHRCIACGHTKKNKMSMADDFETLLEIARRIATKIQIRKQKVCPVVKLRSGILTNTKAKEK